MPSAKVYDRPADRKGPPLFLIALAIVVLVAAGFFVYKMLNPSVAAPVKTQSTSSVSPHRAPMAAFPRKALVT